jgi:anti-sigma factor RsiW
METDRDVVELITSYLDGTMAPDKREVFEQHLETCDGCQGYIERVRTVTALSGRPPAETLTPEYQRHLAEVFGGI